MPQSELARMGGTVVGKFLVLYRSTATAAEQMAAARSDPAQAQAGMELWMQWMQKAGDAIVDFGAPLNEVGLIPASDGTAAHIGGYSILQGDSAEAVTALLREHPHFHSPGASIEVLEFLPAPGGG